MPRTKAAIEHRPSRRAAKPKVECQDYYSLVFKGYVDFGDKHDTAKESIDSRWIDPTGILKDDVLMFDLDNKEIDKVILKVLDADKASYLYQETDHGYHVFLSNNFNMKKVVNFKSALTLLVTTLTKGNSTSLLNRPLITSPNFNGTLSDTPCYLKDCGSTYSFYGMKEGDRNESLSKYVLGLASKGFIWDEAVEIVTKINSLILGKSLTNRELKTILRNETKTKYEKLYKTIDKNKSLKVVGLLDAFDVDPPKQYQFLIDRLLYKNCVNLITGDPKTCKSLIANEIVLSTALGKKVFNQWGCLTKGKALLISPELDPRLRIMGMANGYGLNGFERMDLNNVLVPDNQKDMTYFSWSAYKGSLIEMIDRHRPILVVLDPLAYIFDGDITDQKEVGDFIKDLKGICEEYDTTILLTHHNNRMNSDKKINKISGSAAIGRFVDSIIYLQKEKDNEEQDFDKTDTELDSQDKHIQLIKGEYRYGNEGYKYWNITFNFSNNVIVSSVDRIKNINDSGQEKLDRELAKWDIQSQIKTAIEEDKLKKEKFTKDEVLIVVKNNTGYSATTYEKITKEALSELVKRGYLISNKKSGYSTVPIIVPRN